VAKKRGKPAAAPVIVWLRRDLRLHDNPALHWATTQDRPVIVVYVHPTETKRWQIGAASQWWLHHSLTAFSQELDTCGARLLILRGQPLDVLARLIGQTKATAVVWNRRYEPDAIATDAAVKATLKQDGIEAHSFAGNVCHEPWTVVKADQSPYRVFTAWWRAAEASESLPTTDKVDNIDGWQGKCADALAIAKLQLLPALDWADGFTAHWKPGEAGARQALQSALDERLTQYNDSRDIPSITGTSRVSAHLAFGELSPRTIVAKVRAHRGWKKAASREQLQGFVRQIGWHDFANHLLFHFPDTPTEPLDKRFEAFPWVSAPEHLRAWQRGQTGIPLVDAGMRELWQTGWMHNRVRMITASLLIKNLGVHWLRGAEWFWDTLVDADLANNTMGWQWVAGCGADAAPYFRVFSPQRQGERFDKQGAYVRRWVPELEHLPDKYIHSPWEAPPLVLQQANIELGVDYPAPIIDLSASRKEALERFAQIKK
jgi:deoxyribodipyrimidine photo-lyase